VCDDIACIDMANFDFITDDDLRHSLEQDLTELIRCHQANAWKAVHVLAGSIIEATLIDYLVSAGKIAAAAAYKTTLAELIELAEQSGVLSRKSVELSSIVRDYRNLIHPGRAIRLSERVDGNGATIAKTVIEIVVDEVATKKKQTYGYTAEQIIRKLEEDSSALSIADHLLRETRPVELKRLLLSVLPAKYLEGRERDFSEDYCRRLRSLYRVALELADDEIRRAVGSHYVAVLKEGIGSTVQNYEIGLFQSSDLKDIDLKDHPLVISHFLATMKEDQSTAVLETAQGITTYLEGQSLEDLIRILVKAIIREGRNVARKHAIEQWFYDETWKAPDVNRSHKAKLKAAIAGVEKGNWDEQASHVLNAMLEAVEVPF
jgi:hypothetical protein